MDTGKDLEANLSNFSILVKSFAHNDKKFEDEDLAVIIFNSLPDSSKDIKNVIKYSKDNLTQTIVTSALRSRELEVKRKSRIRSREENMFVKERAEKKENNFNNRRSKLKSKN
ncbi:Hypothetical predicted protein [Olea europaea subsp. europaea]|uniref:Uncharacterized protein n=1 Tax=Olea europaea subsp. europaea TaxID=158383 RepID=A0A8S0Q3W2_OLEEU|nr:Hypothetical predicted protein [Olea europaea subsp. europaea]